MDGRYFIFLLLPLSVYGKKTEVTFYNNAEEILQKTDYEATQAQRKQFMKDFMGQTFDTPPRAILTYYESAKPVKDKGNIYHAFLRENNKETPFILKETRDNSLDELKNAQKIEKTLLSEVGKKDAEYGYLQGLSFVNTKSGFSSNGHFVNKLVPGLDLHNTILSDTPQKPYEQGAPDDLKEALLRASTLISGIAAMRHIGYGHGDLHLHNIMIENNPELGYPCRIIDFEFPHKIPVEPDQSDTQENDLSAEFINHSDRKSKLFYYLPYALAYILFGKYNDYSPKKIHRNKGDKSEQLFSERVPCPFYRHFSFINKLMEHNLHRSYPEPILRRLVILIASLTSPYLEDHPTLPEIIEELQDMALADWDNGYYSIQ